jgi:hypothetical protein
MGFTFFIALLVASALILVASVMVSNSFVGGIELGQAHIAVAKCALLLLAVNLVALVPYGVWLTLPVWWLGFVYLFRVNLFAAWLPVGLCFGFYVILFFLIRLALGGGFSLTTVPGG